MMKVFKWILVVLCSFLVALYLSIYLVLPYFLNQKDYSKIITKKIKENTGLIVLIQGYKLSVSPTLNLNIKAKEIQALYPDKRPFLDIKKSDISISPLYLLKKEIRITQIKADELQFSTKLLKNRKSTLQDYIEKNVKSQTTDFSFAKKLPNITVQKYLIKLTDEESSQKFKLKGKSFKLKQALDFKNINIETEGDLFCFNKKYVHYKTKITVPTALLENRNKTIFDFIPDELYKYDFQADVISELKIHEKNKKFDYISGKTDINNFKLNLGSKKLPPSYFHIIFTKNNAKLISKFYTDIKEATDINADIKISKPYKIKMQCKCPKADITNLQNILVPVLNLFKIKNNLSEFTAEGLINADFKLQTDLKTINSQGTLKITRGKLSHKSIPLKITGINAVVDFSNDSINIKKSDILVNNQPLKITGKVDNKAYGDINISAENLDLNHIMNAFPFLKPEKNLIIKSGKVSFSTKIKGKLDKISPDINAIVKNFSAYESIYKIKLSVNEVIVNAKATKEKYTGIIKLNDVICNSKAVPNKSNTIKANNITAKIDNQIIELAPSKIDAGDAKLTIFGTIKNYIQSPESDITTQGTVDTNLIAGFIQQDLKWNNKGYLPIKALIKAKNNNIKLNVKLLANNNNYITPIQVKSFSNQTTLTNIDADINDENITITDVSMYYAGKTNSLLKDIDKTKLKKALSAHGKIINAKTNPTLDKLTIQIPETLTLKIPQTKDGITEITANIMANGNIYKPILNGKLHMINTRVPSLFINAENALVTLNNDKINAQINNLKIKDMNLSVESNIKTDIIKTNKIDYVKISSNFIDMDYLMKIMCLFNPSKYAPGNDFPYIIEAGEINIKSFKMGVIKAQNITAKIRSEKNLLYINKLFADAFGGKAAGRITYNFPYTSIHADLQGRGMSAQQAANAFIPAEKGVSGILDFDTSIDMIGTTQEQQLNTLRGHADVLIRNGRLGQLGRFEHFLYAQNLLSQKLIYVNLNSAKQAISPKDTGLISYLKGQIKFSAGYAHINPILTSGPQMSMYIKGKTSLLHNDVDLKILGKISSDVSSSMGLLGSMTIKDFLDNHTKYGPIIANLFNSFNTEIPEMDTSKIPQLQPDYKYQTKNFQVIISGDPNSVKSVRSFTWVNPPGTKEKILTEKIKKTLSETIQTKQDDKEGKALPMPQTVTPTKQQVTTTPDFLDKIPDEFK